MTGAYLWKCSLEGRHVARFAWETVCSPKEEGGLDVKDLEVWNKTCTIKLLWLILIAQYQQ